MSKLKRSLPDSHLGQVSIIRESRVGAMGSEVNRFWKGY